MVREVIARRGKPNKAYVGSKTRGCRVSKAGIEGVSNEAESSRWKRCKTHDEAAESSQTLNVTKMLDYGVNHVLEEIRCPSYLNPKGKRHIMQARNKSSKILDSQPRQRAARSATFQPELAGCKNNHLQHLKGISARRIINPQLNKHAQSAPSSATQSELGCANRISLKPLDKHDRRREIVIALPAPHAQDPSYHAPRSCLAAKIDPSFKPLKGSDQAEIVEPQVAIKFATEADGVIMTNHSNLTVPKSAFDNYISLKLLDGQDQCAKTVNALPTQHAQASDYVTLRSSWGVKNHTPLKAQEYDKVEIVEPQADIEFAAQSKGVKLTNLSEPLIPRWVDSSCSSKSNIDMLVALDKLTLDAVHKSYDIGIPCDYSPSSMDKFMIDIAKSLVSEFSYILSYEISVEHALDHARYLTRSLIRLGAPLSGWNATVQSILRVVEQLHALRSPLFSGCMFAFRERSSQLNKDAREALEQTNVTCHATETKMWKSVDEQFALKSTLKSALDTLTLKLKETEDEHRMCEKKLRGKLSSLLVELSSLFSA